MPNSETIAHKTECTYVRAHMCMCLYIGDSSSILGPVGETKPHDSEENTQAGNHAHTVLPSSFAVPHNALLWLWLQLPSGHVDLCEANVS